MKTAPVTTIKDVARLAKVHYSTVSLALRDHPSIPLSTRERIRRVALRAGYRPNPVLSALSRFRRRDQVPLEAPRIAYLVNRPPERHFDHLLYQQQILAGARQQAEAMGYQLERMFVAPGHHDAASLTAHFGATGTAGFILGAFEPGLARLELDWDQYSIVKIDSRHIPPAAPVVSNDQLQVVRLAFQRLTALGYRRIGMAVGRGDEESTDHRHAMGYLIEQSVLPQAQRVPPLFFPYDCPAPTASRLLGRWVRRYRVDAVLCNWLNIDELLSAAGLHLPEEVACACLCLLAPRPTLAGVVPNLPVVGAQAVSHLASLLRSNERGPAESPPTTYVQVLWQDGLSAPRKA